jgi:tripartite-type tricarboxylate transporter receptor subunit TctC
MPDVPTLGEAYPGLEMEIWLALFAPAATPQSALRQLRAGVADALASAPVRERLSANGGLRPIAASAEAFERRMRVDFEQYGELLASLGLSAQ